MVFSVIVVASAKIQKNMERQLIISYKEYESLEELDVKDRSLMQRAIAATESAYAPYSNFHVGAAVRLGDDTIVEGSNQENMAYPSGLCAERTAMFSASAQYPGAEFDALAIVGCNADHQLVSAMPCGACRQVMAEYEQRQHKKMRILTYVQGGRILCFEGVENLLPFGFDADF